MKVHRILLSLRSLRFLRFYLTKEYGMDQLLELIEVKREIDKVSGEYGQVTRGVQAQMTAQARGKSGDALNAVNASLDLQLFQLDAFYHADTTMVTLEVGDAHYNFLAANWKPAKVFGDDDIVANVMLMKKVIEEAQEGVEATLVAIDESEQKANGVPAKVRAGKAG